MVLTDMNISLSRRYPRRRAEHMFPFFSDKMRIHTDFTACRGVSLEYIHSAHAIDILPANVDTDFTSVDEVLSAYGADVLHQALLSDQPIHKPLYLNRQKCIMGWRFEQKLYTLFATTTAQNDPCRETDSQKQLKSHFFNALERHKYHIAYALLHQAVSAQNYKTAFAKARFIIVLARPFLPTLCQYMKSQNKILLEAPY